MILQVDFLPWISEIQHQLSSQRRQVRLLDGGHGELGEELRTVAGVLALLTVEMEDYSMLGRNKNYSQTHLRELLKLTCNDLPRNLKDAIAFIRLSVVV